MQKKSILIVDGDSNNVDVLKLYLEESGYKVYTSYYGKQVFNILEKIMPSLIIINLMLPDITGEKICTLLREKYDFPIIILSEKASEEDVLNGYSIGADDYIIKPFKPRQIVAKVMALLRRTTEEFTPLVNNYSFNSGELVIDTLKHQIKKEGEEIKTTTIEYKLLLTIIRYPKVFTRKELITIIFGNNYEETSIDHYFSSIL